MKKMAKIAEKSLLIIEIFSPKQLSGIIFLYDYKVYGIFILKSTIQYFFHLLKVKKSVRTVAFMLEILLKLFQNQYTKLNIFFKINVW